LFKSKNKTRTPRRLYAAIFHPTPGNTLFCRLLPAFSLPFLKKPAFRGKGEKKKEWRSEIQLKKGYTPSKKKEDKIF